MTRHVPRIYIKNLDTSSINKLPEHHNNHILNVLRMNISDEIIIFNEIYGEWLASIVSADNKKGIYVRCIKERPFAKVDDKPKLCIAFGMIKPDNMKLLIEKITELGVDEIYPLLTEYTNVAYINIAKYEKIIISAAEQSGRITIPLLHEPMSFRSFVNQIDDSEYNLYVAMERHSSSVKIDTSQNCGFIIGPEGGFSESEKKELLSNEKIKAISLSENILRSETAAIACAAAFNNCL